MILIKYKIFYLLLITSVFYKIEIFGQSTRWIQFQDTPLKTQQSKIIGADARGLFLYSYSNRQRTIGKYNFALGELWSKPFPIDAKNLEIEHVLAFPDHIKVFFSIYNSSAEKHGLFCQLIPYDRSELEPTITLIDQANVKERKQSIFKIQAAPEYKGFAVLHMFNGSQKVVQANYYQYLADNSLQQQGSIDLSDMQEKQVDFIQMHVDESNLYVMLATIDLQKKKAQGSEVFQLYEITSLGKMRSTQIAENNLFLHSLDFNIDKFNKQIIIAGFYGKASRNSILGTVYARFPIDSMDQIVMQYQSLPKETIDKLSLGKKNSQGEIYDYLLKNLIIRSDGGVVLVAESVYTSTRQYMTYNQGFPVYRTVTYFHYDDILMVNLDANGVMGWHQTVPKSQISFSGDNNESFAMMKLENKIIFAFNEEERSRSRLKLMSIDVNGKLSTEAISHGDAKDALIVPADGLQISPGTMLIPAFRKKKQGIIRLVF